MKVCHLLLITVLLVATAESLGAREMRVWTSRELLEKSDLVVIARPTAIRDTEERIDLPRVLVSTPDGRMKGLIVIGVESTFRVSVILKGDKGIQHFVVHHYRLPTMKDPVLDGPTLVAFDPTKTGAFLLFLVREKDGRYAPSSGQTDPGQVSVHALGMITE